MVANIDKPAVTRDELTRLLNAHGIYPTQQRIEIAQLMLRKPQHLSAEQVLAAVNVGRTVVSKATVYNTLGLFAEKGLIKQVIVDPAKVFYDSNTGPHYHFYNVDTGTLHDVGADQLALGALPPLPPDTTFDGVEVIIRLRSEPSESDADSSS